MTYLLLFLGGIPVFALVFTLVTYALGSVSQTFKPQEASFGKIYGGFLIIAAIYLLLSFLRIGAIFGPRMGGILGLVIMTLGYRYVFDAGWVQALVIGILGGIVGWVIYANIVSVFVNLR